MTTTQEITFLFKAPEDENADGVCDNRTDCSFEVTCPMPDRNCPQADCRNDGFQDEDNDGICDHYAEGCSKHPSEIGCRGENTPGREKGNCHRKGK